jgi:phage tail-like protein
MGDPALSLVYKCTIDGFIPLGIWNKIEGLGFEYKVTPYREGGVNGFEHKFVGPVSYTNLKLSRPVDSNSKYVSLWIQSVMVKVVPQTMSITALSSAGEEITTWNLANVIPVKWTGPTLDIMGNAIAMETLEVYYEQIIGFGELGTAIAGAATGASVVRSF